MGIDITCYWYDKSFHVITFVLLPLSWLFHIISRFRRWLYHTGMFKTYRFAVPIIVVGNITAGGTGKTPLVIWLAQYLREQGYKPGIVTRGFGGKKSGKPRCVNIDSVVSDVGDEAVLIARKSACPVVVGADRVAAVSELLARSQCDIVISDDGLQHYRLQRNIEIAVVDGVRRFGNNHLLPAGPLREKVSRLNKVDFVVINGGNENDKFTMSLIPDMLISIKNPENKLSMAAFQPRTIHAIAAIGNPGRFFSVLKAAGFDPIEHVFQDHYLYQPDDLQFYDSLPIVMTEKDAVKCESFANENYWCLPVTASINTVFQEELSAKLKQMESQNETESDFSTHSCRVSHVIQRPGAGKSD